MDVLIITALFAVLGIIIGWKAGTVWGAAAESDRQYWLRNLAAVLIGVALSAVVAATGLLTLVGLAIGLIGGAVAGLKMGYGKSVGVWQKHDKLFRVNKDQVAAAKSAEEAAAAGVSERDRASRDVVSVNARGEGSSNAKKGR